MCFSIVICVSSGGPGRPSAVHNAPAARDTRLVSSSGIPAVLHFSVNGPGRLTVDDLVVEFDRLKDCAELVIAVRTCP